MKKYLYYALKIIIFIVSFFYIEYYLDTKKYDCINNCIFDPATKTVMFFLLFSFILFFFEKFRNKSIYILKIFIPAIFIIYSSKYYLEEIKYTEGISIQKYYIDLNYKLNFLDLNQTQKVSLSNINKNLDENKVTFENFNKDVDSYRLALGKATLILTIGMFVIIILDILSILFNRNEKENATGKIEL
ncbi:MAG: hypothetical protein AB7D38_07665 [Sulfurimonas sp.]|uniref:hypothetical protein n=1 Tax=Sulfurimonas sp. TaxID=2022749 RepID=UPI003D0C5EAB